MNEKEQRQHERREHGHESDPLELIAERLETLANVTHRIEHGVEAMRGAITNLERNTKIMATDLTRLTQEVSETGTAVDSAITLINGLAQQIRDLATDPAAINALADSLDAKASALAQAVVDNTPAETPPVEPPTE